MADHDAAGVKPVIGISCCIKLVGEYAARNHAASDTYVNATDAVVGAVPLLIPANGRAADIDSLLSHLDGLMLTGSRSNVDPALYDGPAHPADTPEDRDRDAVTNALIRAAVERGIPLLGICRGLQEINVALGGSLHQRVEHLPGRLDHSSPVHPDFAVRIGNRHEVALSGEMARIAGDERIIVNSLHHQAIDRLGRTLVVEGRAVDGTVEAIRVEGAEFAIGVQWHPEYDYATNPVSRAIFERFGDAVRRRACAMH
jgi:putative glutamine amidotransferase